MDLSQSLAKLSIISWIKATISFFVMIRFLLLTFSFDCAEPFLRLNWAIPLFLLKCRALNVDTANLRHRNAEGSPSQWRTFGQLVKSKKRFSQSPNSLQPIPKFASVNPHIRFSQSPIAIHSFPPVEIISKEWRRKGVLISFSDIWHYDGYKLDS